jgi:hypothetical protein
MKNFSILTLRKITLSIKIHNTATLSKMTHHILAQCSDVCHNFLPFILGVDKLLLTGTVSSVLMVILSVFILTIAMLSVIVLTVMAALVLASLSPFNASSPTKLKLFN